MTQIRLTRAVMDTVRGSLAAGTLLMVTREHADQLIRAGAAVEVMRTAMQAPDATASRGPPIPFPLATSASARASSSRQGRAQKEQTSAQPPVDTSSLSTTAGASRPRRTRSTRATQNGGTTTSQRSQTSRANAGRKPRTPPNDIDCDTLQASTDQASL
jgi:hypothetical protein